MEEIKLENIFTKAWNSFKENWQSMTLASVLIYFLPLVLCIALMYGSIISIMVSAHANQSANSLQLITFIGSYVLLIVGIIVVTILSSGIYKMAYKAHHGEKVKFSDVWLKFGTYFKILGAMLLIFIACFIGMLLCYIPGLIVMFFSSLTITILAVKEETGVIDAIKESCRLIKENWKIALLLFLIVSVASSLLSSTGIGIALVMPLTALIKTALYIAITEKECGESVPPSIDIQ